MFDDDLWDELDDGEDDSGECTFQCAAFEKEVLEPMHVKVRTQITTVDDEFHSYITVWHAPNESNKFSFFLDTGDPDLIVNAIIDRLHHGQFHLLKNFAEGLGKQVNNPLEFRFQMDAELGPYTINE